MILRICIGVGVRVCVYEGLYSPPRRGIFCCVAILFDYLSALVVRDHLDVLQVR